MNNSKSKNKIVLMCAIGLIITLLLGRGGYTGQIVCRMMIAACLACGLDICVGIAGQLSLGHAVFMAIGSYSCAVVTYFSNGLISIGLSFLCSILLSFLFSFIVGYIILGLRGDYLAVCTLGMGEIVRVVLENTEFLGGSGGFYNIPKFTSPINSFMMFVVCLCIGVKFSSSKGGFLARTVGQDEYAAGSIGVNIRKTKVKAFIISAVITSMAGVMYAGLLGFISPRDFGYNRSVDILAAVILGGSGTVIGPMLAAMCIEGFFAVFQTVSVLRMVLYSLALIIFTISKYKLRGDRK